MFSDVGKSIAVFESTHMSFASLCDESSIKTKLGMQPEWNDTDKANRSTHRKTWNGPRTEAGSSMREAGY